MSYDSESKTEQGATEAGASLSKGSSRSDKRLGRGLEEVSHLFLSNPGGEEIQPGVSEPARPGPGDPACPVALRPCPSLRRAQLVSLLKRETAALEEGLKAIDTDIPCDACGTIDLLAVDFASQLTIIDLDLSPGEAFLLRGIGHCDWAVRNVPSLRRMYPGHVINFSLKPRLFLIAPDFSVLFRCAARQITSPQIRWFRYHPVAVAGGTGVLFEAVWTVRTAHDL